MNFVIICLHCLDMRDFHSNMRNTPFLDSLRSKAVFIPMGRAQGHHHGDSLNADMTGMWSIRLSNSKLNQEGYIQATEFHLSKTLIEYLQENNYEIITRMKCGVENLGSWAVNKSLTEAWLKNEPERLNQFNLPHEMGLKEWISKVKQCKQKFYAHIILRDTHRPWGQPERLSSLTTGTSPEGWQDDIFFARKVALDKPDEFATLRRKGLENADKIVKQIFEEMEGVKDVTYIVYSDHGEVFDHFRYNIPFKNTGNNLIVGTSHGAFPYEVLYANMQMWIIPNQKPITMKGIGRSIDFAPTILKLAGINHSRMDGEDMIPFFQKKDFPSRSRYAENRDSCCSFVREDNMKFIAVELLSEIPEERANKQRAILSKYHHLAVFDLNADPWEYNNLIDTPLGQEVFQWAIRKHRLLKEVKPPQKDLRKRVLLINPRVSKKAPFTGTVSLGLASLAAYIRKQHFVLIADIDNESLSDEDILDLIEENEIQVVGFTGMTYQGKNGWKLAKKIKEMFPHIKTVFGGPFYSAMIQQTLEQKHCDFVVIGEGEETILELLNITDSNFKKIKGLAWKDSQKIIVNPMRDQMDIDKLPFPARDLLPNKGMIFDARFPDNKSMMALFSRGCPGNCIFCASPRMWGNKLRLRNLNLVIAELKDCMQKYDINQFCIDDDVFTVNKEYITKFCKRLIEEKINITWRANTRVGCVTEELLILMKQAGCLAVTYGIESGNAEIRNLLKKPIPLNKILKTFELHHKIDFPAVMLLIIGNPGETEETIADSIELVKKCSPNGGFDFQIMQPHPGTELADSIAENYGKIITKDWDDYFSDNITYIPNGFSKRQFYLICKELTRRKVFYKGEELSELLSEQKGNVVYIPPHVWDAAEFDKWDAYYWRGDRNKTEGYTHALGRDEGFISYIFHYDGTEFSEVCLSLRISSHVEKNEEGNDPSSEIEVLIDGISLGRNLVSPKSFDSKITKWRYTDSKLTSHIKKGKHTLTFKIPSDSKFKNGITIYYKELNTSACTPIELKFLK